jgi:hypothetical protein
MPGSGYSMQSPAPWTKQVVDPGGLRDHQIIGEGEFTSLKGLVLEDRAEGFLHARRILKNFETVRSAAEAEREFVIAADDFERFAQFAVRSLRVRR